MNNGPATSSVAVSKFGEKRAASPVISIITISFHDPDGLRSTILSLMNRGTGNFELIVVEGADPSTGTAHTILEELSPAFPVVLAQGYDSGPYDAMNRGVILSSGEWVWFMNSGDLFGPEVRMKRLEEQLLESSSSWLVGRAKVGAGQFMRYKGYSSTPDLISGSYTPCHQAVIVRREMFVAHGLFDTRYRISSDYDFMCKLGELDEPLVSKMVLTHYLGGGISDKNVIRREFESATIRVRRNRLSAPKEYLRFLVRSIRWIFR